MEAPGKDGFDGQEAPEGYDEQEAWSEVPEAWDGTEGHEGMEEPEVMDGGWDQDGREAYAADEADGPAAAEDPGRRRRVHGQGQGQGQGAQGGLGARSAAARNRIKSTKHYVFKLLCTDNLAANLIGARGATRQQIEDESGCSVWISKRDEVYPNPPFRIVVLHADEVGQLLQAIDRVIDNQIEVAARRRENDAPLFGKEEGHFIFHFALPTLITGKLIGAGGANINQMREQTGAKITVDQEVNGGHKAARVEALPDVIRHVVRLINTLVQERAGSEDFNEWALNQPIAEENNGGPGDGRRASPRGRRDQPDPRDKRERDHKEHHRDHRDRDHRGHRDHRDSHRDQKDSGHRDHREPRRSREAGGRRHGSRSRDRSSRRDRSRRGGKGRAGWADIPEGLPIESMGEFARQFRTSELSQNHAVSSVLPKSHLELLLDRSGEYLAYVHKRTGATVTIEDDRVEKGFCNVMIAGPLPAIYLAHMVVMKSYHDKERERVEEEKSARVVDLQAQLQNLESQLREAQRGMGGGAGNRNAIGRQGKR